MSDNTNKPAKPPYLAYRTFNNFTKGLRDSGIPDRIDRTVMIGQSGMNQSYLLGALRFLNLTDAVGSPTDKLRSLVDAGDSDKDVLKQIVEESYDFIFQGLNIASATEGQLSELFREQGLTGETIRKCATFFTQITAAADIPISPHLKKANCGPGPGRPPRKKGMRGRTRKDLNGTEDQPQTPPMLSNHTSHTLPLDTKGQRQFVIQAPYTITGEELERIRNWLSYQLIITEAGDETKHEDT